YRVFGDESPVWGIGALNALMRAVMTCLVYVLALRAFGPTVALMAAAIHAVDPWEAFWSAFVLKESLAVLLSIVAIMLVAQTLQSRSSGAGVAAGIAIAIASLTRYATLGLFVWTLVLFAWCAWRGIIDAKSAGRIAGAVTLGLIIGLSPWLLRNRSVLGAPIVYAQPGYYFYVSNGDRKSTRLNSSHVSISYAVFCLK